MTTPTINGLTHTEALELLRNNPGYYADPAQTMATNLARLRELASSVSVADNRGASAGLVTVLFGGGLTTSDPASGISSPALNGGGLVDELRGQGESFRSIRTTFSAEFNNSAEFIDAISRATGDPVEDIKKLRTTVGNQFLEGTDGIWGDTSQRFARTTAGDVITFTPLANADRIFTQRELLEIINDPNVNTINRHPREVFAEIYRETGSIEEVNKAVSATSLEIVRDIRVGESGGRLVYETTGIFEGTAYRGQGLPVDAVSIRTISLLPALSGAEIAPIAEGWRNVETSVHALARSGAAAETAALLEWGVNGLSRAANFAGGAAVGFTGVLAVRDAQAANNAGDNVKAAGIIAEWGATVGGALAGGAAGGAYAGAYFWWLEALPVAGTALHGLVTLAGSLGGAYLGVEGVGKIKDALIVAARHLAGVDTGPYTDPMGSGDFAAIAGSGLGVGAGDSFVGDSGAQALLGTIWPGTAHSTSLTPPFAAQSIPQVDANGRITGYSEEVPVSVHANGAGLLIYTFASGAERTTTNGPVTHSSIPGVLTPITVYDFKDKVLIPKEGGGYTELATSNVEGEQFSLRLNQLDGNRNRVSGQAWATSIDQTTGAVSTSQEVVQYNPSPGVRQTTQATDYVVASDGSRVPQHQTVVSVLTSGARQIEDYNYTGGVKTLQSSALRQTFEDGSSLETTTTPNGVVVVRSYDTDNHLAGTITTTPDGAGGSNRVVTLSVNGQALELIQTASAADLADGLQGGDYHTTQVNINGEPALNQALIARSIDDNYPSASDIIDHRASQGLANTVAAGDDANFFGTTASLVQVTGRVDWWNAPEVVRTAGSVSDIISLISALRSHRPLAIATAGANFLSHNSSNPEIAQLAAGLETTNSIAATASFDWSRDLNDAETSSATWVLTESKDYKDNYEVHSGLSRLYVGEVPKWFVTSAMNDEIWRTIA